MSDRSFTDEELRSAFQTLTENRDPPQGRAAEDIWDAVRGASSAIDRRRVVDDIARDPGADIYWRLADELLTDDQRTSPAPDPTQDEDAARPWWDLGAWRAPLGLGLATAAAVAVFVMLPGEDLGPTPGDREGPQTAIVSVVPEGRALPPVAFELAWSTTLEDVQFSITVTTDTLQAVATASGLTEPKFTVPAEAIARFPKAKALMWRVTAQHADGSTAGTTATFITKIQAPQGSNQPE
ncbi:MAG: hypothetical protein AAFN74_26150 [Myxococcota bacterium]